MSGAHALVERHFEALAREAAEAGIPNDVLGRALLGLTTKLWLEGRAWTDVADELRFHADSLDPDQDFEFMRP